MTNITERKIKVKEKYIVPEIEMIEFDAEDIITTSDYELIPQ